MSGEECKPWIYLVESAACPSASGNGSQPWRTVRATSFAGASSSNGWKMGCSRPGQSAKTLAPSTDASSAATSTSSSPDSRTRAEALLATEIAWRESMTAFSSRSRGSWRKSNRRTSSSKGTRRSDRTDSRRLSRPFPSAGMTAAGKIYELQTPAHRTRAKDAIFLPTPLASGRRDTKPERERVGPRLTYALNKRAGTNGREVRLAFVEQMMGFPANYTELRASALSEVL